jgi:hypothetical protein
MGINVTWIDENQKPIEEITDPAMALSRLATSRWLSLSGSTCLRFIEPWGDTVFNQTQIPLLLAELRGELATDLEPGPLKHLQSVIALVEQSIDQTHTYIKFIGD